MDRKGWNGIMDTGAVHFQPFMRRALPMFRNLRLGRLWAAESGHHGPAGYYAYMPQNKARPTVTLLVTDLDNTLWDWFAAWHASFRPMLQHLSQLSGVPQDTLERETRVVHQARRTSEYSYLLNELPSLQRLHAEGTDLLKVYDDAVHILNSNRKRHTRLYPTVLESLRKIRHRGVPIAAYTESVAYWTEWRIRHLELDGVLDVLYSSPDHDFPEGVAVSDLRTRPAAEYGLKRTAHRHVPLGITKPNADVLQTILHHYKRTPEEAVYIGDSLIKDVAMAQQAGVLDVHARYGVADARPEYELLRRVSHWPDNVIAEERRVSTEPSVRPTYAVDHFEDLLKLFAFQLRAEKT